MDRRLLLLPALALAGLALHRSKRPSKPLPPLLPTPETQPVSRLDLATLQPGTWVQLAVSHPSSLIWDPYPGSWGPKH